MDRFTTSLASSRLGLVDIADIVVVVVAVVVVAWASVSFWFV
jgi:hypothetical protein